MVLLGSPDPDSTAIFAETVSQGDPTYAGPLAGVALGLEVSHVLEPGVKEQSDPEIYDAQVGIMEDALDASEIIAAIEQVRQ